MPQGKGDYYPNFAGHVDPQTDQGLRYILNTVYTLKRQLQDKFTSLTTNKQLLNPQQLAQELSVAGSAPLNVTGLIGKLPQTQNAEAISQLQGDVTTPSGATGLVTATLASIVTGTTLTLAKITGGGSNGSITIDAKGRITAYTAPS